jgi:CubicO group peptidase (beta-lactamase class C family)
MGATAVAASPAMRARLAAGHDGSLKPAGPWSVPALAGAGSLHSTVDDLLTFLGALGDSRSPIAAALPTMLATRRPGPGIVQALGWWVVATGPADEGILTHDGGTLGYASSLAYDPKTRTGVAVLSNTANGVGDIARHLLRPAVPLTRPAPLAPKPTEAPAGPTLPEPIPALSAAARRRG